ncbi:MAG: hypothetical protein JNL62_12425 [Bryobacterales bacterium]|nr:hypothetical protein [Bryobacterales bacterium]
MSTGYSLRLLLLGLASFYLVHLLMNLVLRGLLPAILRRARNMCPRNASDLLLAIRLAPAAVGAMFAVAICVPAYLRHEPVLGDENTSAVLCLLAGLSAVVCLQSLARVALALRRSVAPTGDGPILRLTGILSPRLQISRQVRAALSEEQWQTVMRHEEAHAVSRDNLKRLLMLLTPGLIPFDRGWPLLEKAWAEATECAADAAAVDGDPRRALELAEALVRMARLGLDSSAGQLVSPFATDAEHLRVRVDALLQSTPRAARWGWILPASALALTVFVFTAQAWLREVHGVLELLVD